MKRYNPAKAPDPTEWLSLDEAERIRLVRDYHRQARIRPPNDRAHAALHVIVENQAALGEELPVRLAMQRLMDGGLDRHEAIHAVASVFMDHLHALMHGAGPAVVAQGAYNAAVERLTVESWRRKWESDDEREP